VEQSSAGRYNADKSRPIICILPTVGECWRPFPSIDPKDNLALTVVRNYYCRKRLVAAARYTYDQTYPPSIYKRDVICIVLGWNRWPNVKLS
jgi:hypothetical protein